MSDDNSVIIKMTIRQTILTLKINNQNASNWLVRDFINSINCNFSTRTKRIPIALKKIGSYIGKFKNTLSNFQREVSTATKIELEKEIVSEDTEKIKI